jgi:hypothetical protein
MVSTNIQYRIMNRRMMKEGILFFLIIDIT